MQSVQLVGITNPVNVPGITTAEELIAYCARVSNPDNQLNNETAPKLLKYLIKNKHFSPLEIVSVTMEIITTRDIARQILRHRSFSFQEFSQRYSVQQNFITDREARLQDTKNRQNSIETDDSNLQEAWEFRQKLARMACEDVYNWALKKGIAKEQARAVLPEGLTQSKLYMAGTIRSWLHYCELRIGNGTQKEHKVIAEMCWNEIVSKFPTLKGVING